MKDIRDLFRKYGIALIGLVFIIVTIYVMYDNADKTDQISEIENNNLSDLENTSVEEISEEEQWEKGYDLPVKNKQKEKAESDCIKIMNTIADIYSSADKGEASNVVLSHETMEEMQNVVAKSGYPVSTSEEYCAMINYEKMDRFLKECMDQKECSIILYSLSNSGGISRNEFTYDGSDMYLLTIGGGWNNSCEPIVSYISYSRIDEWKYTEKGWFCYTLCVPEPPEVTEIIDGSELIRVLPLSEECRLLSEKCVYPLCYMGNNILCSNWNKENLNTIDYNAAFEYFYKMKYGKRLDPSKYTNGIPAEEFENVIMEYLPVTAQEIRSWAVYDETTQTYKWASLGCGNYSLSYFGTALPEVVSVQDNEDGTTTLTVDAVCDMVIANDAIITHELTVKFSSDGSFQYLGNKILNDGTTNVSR